MFGVYHINRGLEVQTPPSLNVLCLMIDNFAFLLLNYNRFLRKMEI